jgi:hypothetical protein
MRFRVPFRSRLALAGFLVSTVLVLSSSVYPQSRGALQGRIVDLTGAVMTGVNITVRNRATSLERIVQTDREGNYHAPALPVGSYRIEAHASGFQTQIVESLTVKIGLTTVQDFQLRVGDVSQEVTVTAASQAVERTTTSVGHMVDSRVIQEIPLNGRHFLDVGLLTPGSVTPPQSGFSTPPMRGLGALAINTAGNREETVNYLVNGVTLNNLTFSSISYQLSIDTIQEFKVDNSTVSAEYGQSSGAVVNIATRSGGNNLHGEIFEFLRNDALDARNFFSSDRIPPFKRNQFGGHLGGPIVKDKAFFLFSYEALHQRQGLNLNSVVLSEAERALASDRVILNLIPLIPHANSFDSSGTPRFVGAASAPVDVEQWAGDISYNRTRNSWLHGYYDLQRNESTEPNQAGNTIPGFGHYLYSRRQIFTLTETDSFGSALVNEMRFGFNRLYALNSPNAQLNPADFGILNGISQPIGLPQINIAGGGLNFGGPAPFPSGRGDTTFTIADIVNRLSGRHSLKFGGEFRQFLNNNFRVGTGTFNFPTIADFLADTANSFSVTLGPQSNSIAQGALGFFVQDNYMVRPNLTLELGLRYEWNMTPSERYDRFIVFDPQSASLLRKGQDIYHQNNRNFQPRVGFAWDPFGQSTTVLRGAYAILTDQPMTSLVRGTSANPPLAIPLTFTGTVRFDDAINLAQAAGLSPQTVDKGFNNAYMQSWNLNIQRELTPNLALMVGYFGSKGTHLILRRNINQPVNGVRPYPFLSASSPILPGTPLGNITQAEGTGNSSYNALWVTGDQRLTRGLQLRAYYTWSKSLDYNSLSSQGVVVQNSYDLRGDRGPSDFDARHRFVVSAIYELPFRGSRYVEGWQLAAIVQMQSGNPVNIVTGNVTVNGVPNTLRPDVSGPIRIIGSTDRWFDTSVFTAVDRFGNFPRNVVVGPGFNNTDFSVIKDIKLRDKVSAKFRVEFFDLFNHANFGQPGNVVGTPAFGRITNTRFPTGESGSSRQVQVALKLVF